MVYEADLKVKEQQLQALQSKFEDLKMHEHGTFNVFYMHLSIITSQAAEIGHAFLIHPYLGK